MDKAVLRSAHSAARQKVFRKADIAGKISS
jgi:hypothetical protein